MLVKKLVGLTQLANLACQHFQFVGRIACHASAFTAVDFRLLYPIVKRLRCASNIVDDRHNCVTHGRLVLPCCARRTTAIAPTTSNSRK